MGADSSVVVALRWGGEQASAETLANEVRGAMDRAAALGAHLVGVSADGASFAFDEGAMEEAVELAVSFIAYHSTSGSGPDGTRWRVGIGVGSLAPVREEVAFERLSVGPGALRAAALARVAQPGEVVVDAACREAAAGSLLAVGRRVATLGDSENAARLRGLVLDVREPWRRGSGASLEQVGDARVVGREASLAMIEAVEPGGVAVVRAAAGVGGTRFLEEIGVRTARSLTIEPVGCSVEPLGALRVAFERAMKERKRELGARENELRALLVSGRGVDVEGASDLIRAFLAGARGESLADRAWILVDDASLVDRATLEAIGHAASVPDVPFAVVARLDPGDMLPAPLASLVVEADLSLKPLQPHEATVLFEEACGGKSRVSAEVVRRWVRRGAGVPLAILESLRHGLAVGELAVRDGASITARSRISGRGRVLSARAWIARRLAVLDTDRPDEALVTALVAIAGPWTERRVVEEAAVDLGVAASFADILSVLVRESIVQMRGERVAPSSRTLRDAVLDRIADGPRRRVHAALAGALARLARGLDLGEAAHHAALAGDHLGAASLALRAEARARKAGLDTWADAVAAFARAEGAPPPSFPVEALSSDDLEEVPPATLRTPPPVVFDVTPTLDMPKRPSLGVARLTTGQIAALPAPQPAKGSDSVVSLEELIVPSDAPSRVESAVPLDKLLVPTDAPDAHAREGLSALANAARRALESADLVGLDAALTAIEAAFGPRTAILRLRGIAALARGEVGRGLELVRASKHGARDDLERARGALACAIGFAVAGDREAAVFEALEALAAERRHPSRHGDEPCARLLGRLLPDEFAF